MKLIKRYSKGIQSILHSKTKPEPWMHALIVPLSNAGKSFKFAYAIYIWDTRAVLETGKGTVSSHHVFDWASDALDNHQPLKGISDKDELQIAMTKANRLDKEARYRQLERATKSDQVNNLTEKQLGFVKHFGMSIYRYNAHMQPILKSKVKAEPWMHIAFFRIHKLHKAYYVIYIWDTRKILDEGMVTESQYDACSEHGYYADDNHKWLQGSSEGAKRFKYSMLRTVPTKENLSVKIGDFEPGYEAWLAKQ
jgi:hypothetical protein